MVPLTVYQIHTIVSVAPVTDKGIIKYTLMVPIVERTVRAITDLQHMKTRFYVIEQLAQSDLLTDLSKEQPEEFRELLKEAFQRADTDNSGVLTGTRASRVTNTHPYHCLQTNHVLPTLVERILRMITMCVNQNTMPCR